MNTVKCPNCGYKNKSTNIRCESCTTTLNCTKQKDNFNNDSTLINSKNIDLESKSAKRITNIVLIFILAQWFLMGLVFTGIGLYFSISDNNKSKNYLETEGILVNYDNCEYDENGDELCNAVYEYTVNGITYNGSPNLLSNHSEFEQTIIVKYNPDNPSEYVMNSGWNWLLIGGIIVLIVVFTIFISIKISIKKLSHKFNYIGKIQSGI